jgi:ribosome maturation factor RimP
LRAKDKRASARFFLLEGVVDRGLPDKVIAEIREIARERGCELLAVETAGAGSGLVLRLVLDRDGGVTLDDCQAVSEQVSPLLDAEDTIGHRYTLEVSSPGIDRKLYSVEDARKFVGRRVRVQTKGPVEGSRNFSGRLTSVDGEVLQIVDDEAGKTYNVSFGELKTARLKTDWT